MNGPASGALGGVSIEALELFVEVLSQSERAASGDDFYDRLCEAVCRLARMRRALIFTETGHLVMVGVAFLEGSGVVWLKRMMKFEI